MLYKLFLLLTILAFLANAAAANVSNATPTSSRSMETRCAVSTQEMEYGRMPSHEYPWLSAIGRLSSSASQPSYVAIGAGLPLFGQAQAEKSGPYMIAALEMEGNPFPDTIPATCYPPLSLGTTSLPTAMAGFSYSVSLAANGGQPPYTWSFGQSSLPQGFSLSSNGALSGTSSTAGTYTFNVIVSDALKSNVAGLLTLTVTSNSDTSTPTPAPTTYCVANSGSDSNSGTATGANCTGTVSAWQSIAHVNAQHFSPGDSILFQDGGTWQEELIPPSSGTSGNLITFGSYGTGAKPILDGANTLTYVLETNGVNYIEISGLEVRNSTNVGVFLRNSTYVTLSGLKVHDIQGQGVYAGLGGGGHTIENCEIYNTGLLGTFGTGSGIQLNGEEAPPVTIASIVQNNYIHDVKNSVGGDHAIYDEVAGDTDRYNHFKNIVSGTAMKVDGNGILIYWNLFDSIPSGGIWIDAFSNVKVYNNTFYNVGSVSPYAAVSFTGDGTESGVSVENNIDYFPGSSYSVFLNINTNATGFSSDYNDAFGVWWAEWVNGSSYDSLASWTKATGQDAHSITGNPLFANASASQFWLATGSPAIGAGVYIPGVSTSNPPNIGAR